MIFLTDFACISCLIRFLILRSSIAPALAPEDRMVWQGRKWRKARSMASMQLTHDNVGEVEAALDDDATAWPPNLGARRPRGIHNHGKPSSAFVQPQKVTL